MTKINFELLTIKIKVQNHSPIIDTLLSTRPLGSTPQWYGDTKRLQIILFITRLHKTWKKSENVVIGATGVVV